MIVGIVVMKKAVLVGLVDHAARGALSARPTGPAPRYGSLDNSIVWQSAQFAAAPLPRREAGSDQDGRARDGSPGRRPAACDPKRDPPVPATRRTRPAT